MGISACAPHRGLAGHEQVGMEDDVVWTRQEKPHQVLLSVQSGSRRLRGSSEGRAARRPCPLWACRKFCLLIRCFPRKELSREKASGVKEASSSSEEEGGPKLGASGTGCSSSGWGVSGKGEERGGGEEEGSGAGSGRLAGGRPGGSAGPGELAAEESKPPEGRILSLAIVAWMELMGTSPPRTRSWES